MNVRIITRYLIAATLLFSTLSCSKFKELTAFDVAYNLPRTTFTFTPSKNKGGEELLYSGYFNANLDSILNANGFSSGLVGNTTLTSCTISIKQPSDITFSWLQSARAEVSANAAFTPFEQVASAVNIDPTNKSVVLTTYNTNIRPYLNGQAFYFRIYGVLNGPVPADWVEMYLDGSLQMHLEPL